MVEVIKVVSTESALTTNVTFANSNYVANTTVPTGNAHVVLRIYNGNTSPEVITLAGSVAGNLTIGPANTLFLEKLWSDTVVSQANSTGLVASIVAFTH